VLVLIDTWWNVNSKIKVFQAFPNVVLIDTWWNVNYFLKRYQPFPCLVLIDTWWNVNKLNTHSISRKSSFNRYMVECELIYHMSIFADNKF